MSGGELNQGRSSRIAGSTITGQLFVKAANTGDRVAIPASAQGERVDGVAEYDAATGEAFAVVYQGEFEMICGDTVTRGDLITTGADARVETAASGDFIAGRALTSAADGELIRVHLDLPSVAAVP